ncbi:MAG: hypothetical protein H0T73_15185, partial [Ardenticatenales bacterium]|nr:hypothetical protein [Ardenticatenales bacterium]
MTSKEKAVFLLIPIVAALLVLLGGRTATSQGATAQQQAQTLVNHLEGVPSGPIAAQGNYVYMAFQSKLVVLDTSDPTAPRRVGWLFFTSAILDMELRGAQLYLITKNGDFHIVNVANSGRPVIEGLLRTTSSNYYSILADERFVYIVGEGAIDVVNVSAPSSPKFVGHLAIQANVVAVQGGYLYWAGYGGVEILSVVDPANPTRVGSYVPSGLDTGATILLANDRAYLTAHTGNDCGRGGCYDSQLIILDISNPTSPVELG